MKVKRQIHKTLSQGTGKQLVWLACLCLMLLSALIATGLCLFPRLQWQDILALFLDPGCFGGPGEYDVFRIVVALTGCFTFSALLVSVFSNIIGNISDSWHNGTMRYHHRRHILILGAHHHLYDMLQEMADSMDECDIVIMTSANVEETRSMISMHGIANKVARRITLYSGSRYSNDDLTSVAPDKATTIYIIGEDHEQDHDALNLTCVRLLETICKDAQQDIPAYVLLTSSTTTEIMARTVATSTGMLHVDYVNLNDYEAEQLMVDSDFMPVIKCNDKQVFNLYILGLSDMARATACTAAHLAHYPNLTTAGKSCINIVGRGAVEWARKFMSSYQGLARLSTWETVDEGGKCCQHIPSDEDGDYLDISWRFIDCDPESELFHSICEAMSTEEKAYTRFAVCYNDDQQALATALHLPACVRDIPVAVYSNRNIEYIQVAINTGITNPLWPFGNGSSNCDALFRSRATMGKRVNYLYNKAYSPTPAASAEEAWHHIPEAHKLSSIYSAMALPLRAKCTGEDTTIRQLCEMEHRRWMMSCLLMGYQPLSLKESEKVRKDKDVNKQLKSQYVHADITPFDALNTEEQDKDRLLVENMQALLE